MRWAFTFVLIFIAYTIRCQPALVADSIIVGIDRSDFDSNTGIYTVSEFDSLLKKHNDLLRNLDLRISGEKDEVLYEQSQMDGLTTVQRKAAGIYRFYEYWILPLGLAEKLVSTVYPVLRACSGFGFVAKASKFSFQEGKICSRSRVPTAKILTNRERKFAAWSPNLKSRTRSKCREAGCMDLINNVVEVKSIKNMRTVIFIIPLLISCQQPQPTPTDTIETNAAPEQANEHQPAATANGIRITVGPEHENHYDLAGFDRLVKENNGLLSNTNIEISDRRNETLYQQRPIDGSTNIQRVSAGVYRLHEYWWLPVGREDLACQVHLFSFDADLNTGIITADTGNIPLIRVWNGRFPKIIADFDKQEAYEQAHPTGENWDKVTDAQFSKTRAIACQLALATLNGCEPCRQRFNRIRKTFDYMNAGETSEILQTYERLVSRYDKIRNQKPGVQHWFTPVAHD